MRNNTKTRLTILATLLSLTLTPLINTQSAWAEATPYTIDIHLTAAQAHWGETVTVAGQVKTSAENVQNSVEGKMVRVTLHQNDLNTVAGDSTTDKDGNYTLNITPNVGQYTIDATLLDNTTPTISEPLDLTINKAQSIIRFTTGKIVSEKKTTLTLTLQSPTAPQNALASQTLQIETYNPSTKLWEKTRTGTTNLASQARGTVTIWKSAKLRASWTGTDQIEAATSGQVQLKAIGEGKILHAPKGAPEPKTSPTIANGPAVGLGANATIQAIPDKIWNAMQGLTWHSGCLSRNQLRYVTVNYWGFDGYRYRGEIVIAKSVSTDAAAAFTDLYNIKYPFRLMVSEDVFGKNPKGPGANDYAAMRADNTSGFNCRYVVGKEKYQVWSPHASGRALDINTWENPYYSPTGIYPNSWYYTHHRDAHHGAILYSNSKATQILNKHGWWNWGGNWGNGKDYQHFDRASAVKA